MPIVRYRCTYLGFGQLWTFIKDDPALADSMGFIISPSATPLAFMKLNGIELVDED